MFARLSSMIVDLQSQTKPFFSLRQLTFHFALLEELGLHQENGLPRPVLPTRLSICGQQFVFVQASRKIFIIK